MRISGLFVWKRRMQRMRFDYGACERPVCAESCVWSGAKCLGLMFVYIIGNAEKNVFKLGIAGDPFKQLSSIQVGNPYSLSIVCKICVRDKKRGKVDRKARTPRAELL